MKLIYIAGPFSASTRQGVEMNIRRVVDAGVEVAKLGAMPVMPHANTADPRFENVQPYPFWIRGTLLLLERCDAVFTVHGWEQSKGAFGEVQRAAELRLPVFHSLEALRVELDAYNDLIKDFSGVLSQKPGIEELLDKPLFPTMTFGPVPVKDEASS